jgi:hypothetical protein
LLWHPKSHKREHTFRRTVFASILAIATWLCEANFGNVYLRDGESFYKQPVALAAAW